MSTEAWYARADREAARILAQVEFSSSVMDYTRMQRMVSLAWLEGYKAATAAALEAMTR